MLRVLIAIVLLCATPLSAATLTWTIDVPSEAAARDYTYEAGIDGGPMVPLVGVDCDAGLTPRRCVAEIAPVTSRVALRAVFAPGPLARFEGVTVTAYAEQTQPLPVTSETLTIYRQGSATPASAPIVLPRANIQCGQAPLPPVTGTARNPDRAAWIDPGDPASECVYTDPGNGPLRMLAIDASTVYQATLVFANAAGASPESQRSNLFTRPGTPPAAPARLVIVGQ